MLAILTVSFSCVKYRLQASQFALSIHPVASSQRDQQKEVVRLLVMQYGLQKASELSNVPYDVVRQWESRRKRRESKLVTNVTPLPVTVATDNIASELQTLEHKTKLSLARAAAKMSKESENAKLKASGLVHNVAKTAAIVHKWDAKEQNSGNVVVNIALLGVDPASVAQDNVLDA